MRPGLTRAERRARREWRILLVAVALTAALVGWWGGWLVITIARGAS